MEEDHSATTVTHKKRKLYLLISLAVVIVIIGACLLYLSNCLKSNPVVMNAIEENAIILVGKTSWVSRGEIQKVIDASENPMHKQQFERVLKFPLPYYPMTKEQKACLIFGMSSEERIPEDLFDMRFKTVEFTDELAYSTS